MRVRQADLPFPKLFTTRLINKPQPSRAQLSDDFCQNVEPSFFSYYLKEELLLLILGSDKKDSRLSFFEAQSILFTQIFEKFNFCQNSGNHFSKMFFLIFTFLLLNPSPRPLITQKCRSRVPISRFSWSLC